MRTSLPHGIPSQKLENEDFITMDFGCIVEGYRSDMTRTVALGKATPEQGKSTALFWRLRKLVVTQLCRALL